MDHILSFDIGGSKVAWGLFNLDGTLLKDGRLATPESLEQILNAIQEVAAKNPAQAIGIGVPGTIHPNHREITLCTNLSALNKCKLADLVQEKTGLPTTLDNDARCALIGEVWLGSAQEMRSAVMLTLGTGVGGAVMQREKILPHPQDVTQEVGRLVVDPSDVFPAKSGRGSVEAFIGGHNLEKRLSISLADISQKVRTCDKESIELWREIASFFSLCLRAVQDQYSCRNIIIGGIGSKDLEFYLQDEPPCPVIAAQFGEKAGLYGASRIGLDLYNDEKDSTWV